MVKSWTILGEFKVEAQLSDVVKELIRLGWTREETQYATIFTKNGKWPIRVFNDGRLVSLKLGEYDTLVDEADDPAAVAVARKLWGTSELRWSKRGGYAGAAMQDRMRDKLRAMGFVRTDPKNRMSPDGNVSSDTETWIKTPVQVAFYSSYGVTKHDNSFSVTISIDYDRGR
jgi:hypothetical protein